MGPLIAQRNNRTPRKYPVFNDLDGLFRAVPRNTDIGGLITTDMIGQVPAAQ